MCASPSSLLLYFRSKAATEIELAQIGYDDLIILRPGMFGQVHREVKRPMEVVLSALFRVGSCLSSQVYMPLPRLARCMRIVGERGGSSLPRKLVWTRMGNETQFRTLVNKSILMIMIEAGDTGDNSAESKE